MNTTRGQSPTLGSPFAEKDQLVLEGALVLPATSHTLPRRELIHIGSRPDERTAWVAADLNVRRLNQVHNHLWLAGLPQISRPLHDHVRIGRKVVLTEQADLHLVWTRDTLFLKPLPDYLLSHRFWTEYICPYKDASEDARGFLLSYMWLLSSKTDWRIACQLGLLSESISWERWAIFVGTVAGSLECQSFHEINPRYLYGELRMDRLSLIYRFCSSTRTLTHLIRGYNYGYHEYSTFIERNFAWALTAVVYLTIILSAMQLGLATPYLAESQTFQRAAYSLTVFSIVAPLVLFAAGALMIALLVLNNWRYTMQRSQRAVKEVGHLFADTRVAHP